MAPFNSMSVSSSEKFEIIVGDLGKYGAMRVLILNAYYVAKPLNFDCDNHDDQLLLDIASEFLANPIICNLHDSLDSAVHHLKENNFWSQDIDPLLLAQQFERDLGMSEEGDAFQEKYDMYMNEY